MNSKLLPLVALDAYNDAHDDALVGITPFLKTVFLIQEHADGPECYEFQAGDYGPFSKTLYLDIETLAERNFINTTDVEQPTPIPGVTHTATKYTLTDKGAKVVRRGTTDADMFEYNLLDVRRVVEDYVTSDTYDLLETVYASAPKLFTNQRFKPASPV